MPDPRIAGVVDRVDQRDPALVHQPVYLTADVPAIGGTIKARPEDFLVEELPLYEPVGQGEHIYLFIEKRRLSTIQLVEMLARHFNVPRSAIGYAGMKDKHAITRQHLSIHVPGRTHADFPMIDDDRMGVLWVDQHTNKLRLGHLRGNRFSIKIRDVAMTDVVRARAVIDQLVRTGVPNLFGPQRFGVRCNNHLLGRLMLMRDWSGVLDELLGPDSFMPDVNARARELYKQGEYAQALEEYPGVCRAERQALGALKRRGSPSHIVHAIDQSQRKFWLSAMQSAIFNRVLLDRMQGGTLGQLIDGDVACKHDNGAMFAVDAGVLDDDTTPGRLERLKISPTGPLWGRRMMRACGAVDELELRIVNEASIALEAFESATKMTDRSMTGDRRPLRVPVVDPEVEGGIDEYGHYIRCAFELPKGSYATAVMREIMKSAPAVNGPGQ